MLRKIAAISAMIAGCALAQQQQPAAQTPPSGAGAGTPGVPDDTVVAVLNGRKFTAKDVKNYVAIVPPQAQAAFKADPKQFLRDHAWYMKLVEYAEKHSLDKVSPMKEQLDFARLMLLSQAAYNYALKEMPVTPAEQQEYYETNKESFREARVRMIYLPFSDLNSEGEAKAKAEAVVKRARAGEDFAKLAKENSDPAAHEQSAEPFAVRLKSSQPPEPMRRAILSLKKR